MLPLLTTNRKMFWRIVRRLITAHRGRLFVILLALGAGAAVTAALLNLQVDAKRRLTSEFRAFGANVLISARDHSRAAANPLLIDKLDDKIPSSNDGSEVTNIAFFYLSVEVSLLGFDGSSSKPSPAILVGYEGKNIQHVLPARIISLGGMATDMPNCRVGAKVAAALQIHPRDRLKLRNLTNRTTCFVSAIEEYGGPEDSQILTDLYTVQGLTWVPGGVASPNKVSLIELSVPGTPQRVARYVSDLQRQFPDLDVRPIRQFTEAQAKIYSRISGLLNFTVALVLVLTGLCVMAAMTNVAMERRNDVGLMKAIGGAKRRVLRLFLAEATLLGLAGGAIGAAAGIALSVFLGKAVFGLAARPRLIVYPISVALTLIVAILSAFPLRRLASIRPASVFRGEA